MFSRAEKIVLLLAVSVALSACTPQIQSEPTPTGPPPQHPEPTPTPMPTQTQIPTGGPPPRWRQYEEALANAILEIAYPPNDEGLCEWDLLGQQEQEIYLWAVCQVASTDRGTAGSVPVVVLLAPDGSIEKVILPRAGVDYPEDIKALFPADVQERIFNRTYFDPKAAMEHIALRRKDRTIPPMIVEAGVTLP